ncbi:hypothetical protein [Neobacillus vireti]|uniref:hypothetical protein n=1 Tax=Neobacillus vireti TaxID=220686 RepID=UPI002FFFF4AA
MFGAGILLAGGSFIAISILDKIAEDCGYTWISTTLKLIIPIIGIVVSVYFLQNNSMVRWLR